MQAFIEEFDMVAADMCDIAQKVGYAVTQRVKQTLNTTEKPSLMPLS